jgi:hypothetical protein
MIARFLTWAREVSLGPEGKPSSQRVVGLLSASVLQTVFVGASVMLIRRGQVAAFQAVFDSFALFTATALGILAVNKAVSTLKGSKPPEGEA